MPVAALVHAALERWCDTGPSLPLRVRIHAMHERWRWADRSLPVAVLIMGMPTIQAWNHSPAWTATPQARTANPARAWPKRCQRCSGAIPIAHDDDRTTVSMVAMVMTLKTMVTPITVHAVPLAAAYMTIGINGSHGPKRKIVNNIQGVSDGAESQVGVGA